MDAAIVAANNEDDMEADYAIVETIGADHGPFLDSASQPTNSCMSREVK
jgi:hypothetical protein